MSNEPDNNVLSIIYVKISKRSHINSHELNSKSEEVYFLCNSSLQKILLIAWKKKQKFIKYSFVINLCFTLGIKPNKVIHSRSIRETFWGTEVIVLGLSLELINLNFIIAVNLVVLCDAPCQASDDPCGCERCSQTMQFLVITLQRKTEI